nr:MAG TPA: voltage-gated hydrogen channel protein [Caudoviricetes sp.]
MSLLASVITLSVLIIFFAIAIFVISIRHSRGKVRMAEKEHEVATLMFYLEDGDKHISELSTSVETLKMHNIKLSKQKKEYETKIKELEDEIIRLKELLEKHEGSGN